MLYVWCNESTFNFSQWWSWVNYNIGEKFVHPWSIGCRAANSNSNSKELDLFAELELELETHNFEELKLEHI